MEQLRSTTYPVVPVGSNAVTKAAASETSVYDIANATRVDLLYETDATNVGGDITIWYGYYDQELDDWMAATEVITLAAGAASAIVPLVAGAVAAEHMKIVFTDEAIFDALLIGLA